MILATLWLCAAAATHSETRVAAAWNGLQRYFYDIDGGFWKACGQNGGAGGAHDRFNCKCESLTARCSVCFRWWMAVSAQTMVGLHANADTHLRSARPPSQMLPSQMLPSQMLPSRNETLQTLEKLWRHSPFTSRVYPTWFYVDDYLWYVLLWLDAYRWLAEPRYLEEVRTLL